MQKTNILTAINKFASQIHLNFKDYGQCRRAGRLRAAEIPSAYASLTGVARCLEEIPPTNNKGIYIYCADCAAG
jgi:hypothetical protein